MAHDELGAADDRVTGGAATDAPTVPEHQRLTKRLLRRALEDTGVSIASLADRIHRAATIAERWLTEGDELRHPPLWLLRDRTAVSDRLFDRIVGDLRAAREEQGAALAVPLERVLRGLLRGCSDAIGRGLDALADDRLDADERAELRPLIARVHEWAGRWLRDDEARGVVVPIAGPR